MRISDWSSDVCSSDLARPTAPTPDPSPEGEGGNMTTIPEKRIDAIIERHAALQARMATGDMAPADFVAASKEFAELEPVAAAARAVVRLRGERTALTEMLADPAVKTGRASERGRGGQ